ncbi:hypothetical protein [Mycobacterium sp.]|uniref:hypothetical protein n=1 Tax=Mycobacterium sp. TaxID=1785 RepID=UPI003C721205
MLLPDGAGVLRDNDDDDGGGAVGAPVELHATTPIAMPTASAPIADRRRFRAVMKPRSWSESDRD